MSKHGTTGKKRHSKSLERKLSVFERLGSKSSGVCHHWGQYKSCPSGSSCKYAETHILSTPTKKNKIETSEKIEMSSKKHSRSEVKKSKGHHCPEPDWEQWGLGDLEGADEKALERRRQELKRALQLQLSKEKEGKKKEAPVTRKRSRSSSSSSSVTSETTTSTTSSSTSTENAHKSKKTKHESSSSSDSNTSKDKPSSRSLKKKESLGEGGSKISEKKSKHGGGGEHKTKINVIKKSVSKVITKKSPTSWHDKHSPRQQWNISPSHHKTKPKSPKKYKNESPKRKGKEFVKDRSRSSPVHARNSPVKSSRDSPRHSRKNESLSDKKKIHNEKRHSPQTDRSRDRDRKREVVRRARSIEEDKGGLKKGGKILPLKPSLYNKEVNKPRKRSKSPVKRHETTSSRERKPVKSSGSRDKVRDRKTPEREKRQQVKDRSSVSRSRETDRSREAERERMYKERDVERQKEREEALERCRERQRERERIEKERRDKEDEKKRQRSDCSTKQKDYERELPSLLSLKADHPHSDDSCHRNNDKRTMIIQSAKNHDRKSCEVSRVRDGNRRGDNNRVSHDTRRRPGDTTNSRNVGHEERDTRRDNSDDRRAPMLGRKLGRPYQREDDSNWTHNQDNNREYKKDVESRADWNMSNEHHREWNVRYDQQKWRERDDSPAKWNRRQPVVDEWKEQENVKVDVVERERDKHDNDDKKKFEGIQTVPISSVTVDTKLGSTQNLDEVLSDISDDANDILNQDDDNGREQTLPYENDFIVPSGESQLVFNSASVRYPEHQPQVQQQPTTELFLDQRRSLFDCLGERSLDFEEISDEELEEEARLNKGIVDVLGADWAELVEQTRPKIKIAEAPTSARGRWHVQRVIQRIGVSQSYAGVEFVNNLIKKYGSELSETDTVVCKEEGDKDRKEELGEKQEEVEYVKNNRLKLIHPVSRLHVALSRRETLRNNLFASQNQLKPALSARTDLALRRELCNLSAKEPLHTTNTFDQKLYDISVKLFQDCVC